MRALVALFLFLPLDKEEVVICFIDKERTHFTNLQIPILTSIIDLIEHWYIPGIFLLSLQVIALFSVI